MPKIKIPPLFKNQQQSVKFLATQFRALDFSDPGTGKTRVEIEDFAACRRHGGGCALILAPRSLLYSAWGKDFNTFAPDMTWSIARALNRARAFDVKADAYITNIDAAVWLAKQPAAFFKRFSHLIVDEGSAYKHHTSQRSRAVAKIRRVFEYRRLLTGTPSATSIQNIWHPAFLIDDGKRLGTSFFAFRAAVCEPEQVGPMPNMIKWHDKPNAAAIVSALLKDITIRHAFEDCVDIPKNHAYSVPFHLSDSHLRAYQAMEREQVVKVKGQTISAVNGAVVRTKLLQIASGAVYNDAGEHTLIDSDRYELVVDLAEARPHTLIFYNWEHQRDLLEAELKKRDMTYISYGGSVTDRQRDEAVEYFQNGFYRVFLAHPQSAGHGLTLVRATCTIYASPPRDLELYLQGKKRIHRIGQTERTETIMVTAEGTYDVRAWESIMANKYNMDELLDYFKELK